MKPLSDPLSLGRRTLYYSNSATKLRVCVDKFLRSDTLQLVWVRGVSLNIGCVGVKLSYDGIGNVIRGSMIWRFGLSYILSYFRSIDCVIGIRSWYVRKQYLELLDGFIFKWDIFMNRAELCLELSNVWRPWMTLIFGCRALKYWMDVLGRPAKSTVNFRSQFINLKLIPPC